MSQTIPVSVDAVRTYDFDFGTWAEIQNGDTLVSAVVTSTPSGPTIGAVSIVASMADPSKTSGQVNVELSGWPVGSFHIKILATTQSSAVLPGCIVFTATAC